VNNSSRDDVNILGLDARKDLFAFVVIARGLTVVRE
jgi:hypothetical protein